MTPSIGARSGHKRAHEFEEVTTRMTRSNIECVQPCLDLLRMSWNSAAGQPVETYGTLLEISETSGIFHVDEAVAPGAHVLIYLDGDRTLDAEVESYEQDDYGCYLRVRMDAQWFPVEHQPAYMMVPETPAEAWQMAQVKGSARPNSHPIITRVAS